MDVGTAIFLSSLVFAVVILYGITKDQPHWQKFARGVGQVFQVFVALVIGTVLILILSAIAQQFGR